jgi:hypothetical protein
MAEVHGNRTHPSPLDDTPDLKSGGPTSEPCTSVLGDSNILIITMPFPLASPFLAVSRPASFSGLFPPTSISAIHSQSSLSSIPHLTFLYALFPFTFFCHLSPLFWPDCRFFDILPPKVSGLFGLGCGFCFSSFSSGNKWCKRIKFLLGQREIFCKASVAPASRLPTVRQSTKGKN